MTFVHFSLLFGGLAVAGPIVLHLAMRQRPKTMVFPAMQFLRQRRESNTRRLRLRQWLLLALRCLAIGLLAFALMRPSVNSATIGDWGLIGALSVAGVLLGVVAIWSAVGNRSRWVIAAAGIAAALAAISSAGMTIATLTSGSALPLGDRQAPVAAVLVFETAPRIEYRHNNETRLDEARETAYWLIRQLPFDSQVAVLESRPQPPVFSIDLAAARKAIERLAPTGVPRPIAEVVSEAIELARTSPLARREVFIFTDLTDAAWPASSGDELRRTLADASDVAIYVIDVGAESPMNIGLGSLALSGETITQNGSLRIEADIVSLGAEGERTVELLLEDLDPSRPVIRDGELLVPDLRPRAREPVSVPANGAARVQLQVQGIEPGVRHGFVRVVTADGLAADDVRHFTVNVQTARPVLIVEPPGGTSTYLAEALAPYELRETGQADFACTTISPDALADRDLEGFSAVCLLDPPPMFEGTWRKLREYAAAGGGVALFLGHNVEPDAFNAEAPQSVLPGRLAQAWRSPARDVYLAPNAYDHPALAEFRSLAASVPWADFPVFQHWQLKPLDDDVRVVIRFNQRNAALVDQPIGAGRIITLTTPISDPVAPRGRQAWNELPTGENAWPYFVLVNELVRYLAASGEARLNYACGETATLNHSPQRDPDRYQLFTPGDEPQEITARRDAITVRFTENAGTYRLKGNRGGPVLRGFSANYPADATRLDRIDRQRLDDLIGKDRYQFARGRDEIELGVGESRVGREFYPFLLVVLAATLALEQVFANRFYRARDAAQV